jgi:hypothetical protein
MENDIREVHCMVCHKQLVDCRIFRVDSAHYLCDLCFEYGELMYLDKEGMLITK